MSRATVAAQPWHSSDRFDPRARPLADRHYNRQHVGSPQFAPPGRCLVLLTRAADAFWITSWPFAEYVRHAWAGAWVCSAFRNESPALSSALIVAAVAATVAVYQPPPRVSTWVVTERLRHVTRVERVEVAMVTFVDPTKTRAKRDPGRCYLRAGFEVVGQTKGGLVALGLRADRLPAPVPPLRAQLTIDGAA